jgi:cobalt-zinc-cadmium efflux system protein
MVGDAAVSLAVVIAALLIGVTGWLWLDPATSLAIAVVITIGTWNVLSESVNLAMDAVPASVDEHAVETYLRALPGVTDLHDLHIWALSTTSTALTVHLVRPAAAVDDDMLLATADELRLRFGIDHATIQVETGADPDSCRLAPWNVV